MSSGVRDTGDLAVLFAKIARRMRRTKDLRATVVLFEPECEAIAKALSGAPDVDAPMGPDAIVRAARSLLSMMYRDGHITGRGGSVLFDAARVLEAAVDASMAASEVDAKGVLMPPDAVWVLRKTKYGNAMLHPGLLHEGRRLLGDDNACSIEVRKIRSGGRAA